MSDFACSKCGLAKPASAFNKNRDNISGFDYYCKSCRNEYMAQWAKDNPGAQYKKLYKEQWSNIIRDMFGDVCCQDCGYKEEPAILEWHHKGDKGGPPARIFALKPTRERIVEILTCIPLCPTCHRLRHLRQE